MGFTGAMAVALVLDAAIGWPGGLVARIGHPVMWIGMLIDALDARWNRSNTAPWTRRAAGLAAALVVIAFSSGLAWAVQTLIVPVSGRVVIIGLLAMPFVALRSLYEHVAAVIRPLQSGEVEAARAAVAMIVGRDPAKLDEAALARAAIESLAENTSDGIVAPVFWGALFGLPGIVAYKAVNTLDSMIGHRTDRHHAFGWAAARIDDVANIVPARFTALLFALLGAHPRTALACSFRDAWRHRSINAGWPEAAMAGSLGVRLCGPRFYSGDLADEPWLNSAAPDPKASDIRQGLSLYVRTMVCLVSLLAIIAFV